jgi:GR25 family glycosyltransferase involved in LPS biosynthesis
LKSPKVFIIGVKSRYRGYPLEKQLSNFGFDFENYWGINGKSLSEEAESYLACQLVPAVLTNYSMSTGEICCAIAHLELYSLIVERKISWACILEDDAISLFDPSLIFKSLEDFSEPTILSLNVPLATSEVNSALSKREKVVRGQDLNTSFIKLDSPRLQTYAYLINLQAAELIVERKQRRRKVSARADWPIEIYPGINFYVCKIPIFSHKDDRSDSLISRDRYRDSFKSNQFLASVLRSRLSKISGATFLILGFKGVNFISLFHFLYFKKIQRFPLIGKFLGRIGG